MGGFGSATGSFPSLSPGDLRHWVTFMDQVISDGVAGKKITWVPSSRGAWAKIETIRGVESIRSGQDLSILFLTVSMWFQDGISSRGHILSPSGMEYVINTIENVLQMNQVLILNCQSIGSQSDQGG